MVIQARDTLRKVLFDKETQNSFYLISGELMVMNKENCIINKQDLKYYGETAYIHKRFLYIGKVSHNDDLSWIMIYDIQKCIDEHYILEENLVTIVPLQNRVNNFLALDKEHLFCIESNQIQSVFNLQQNKIVQSIDFNEHVPEFAILQISLFKHKKALNCQQLVLLTYEGVKFFFLKKCPMTKQFKLQLQNKQVFFNYSIIKECHRIGNNLQFVETIQELDFERLSSFIYFLNRKRNFAKKINIFKLRTEFGAYDDKYDIFATPSKFYKDIIYITGFKDYGFFIIFNTKNNDCRLYNFDFDSFVLVDNDDQKQPHNPNNSCEYLNIKTREIEKDGILYVRIYREMALFMKITSPVIYSHMFEIQVLT